MVHLNRNYFHFNIYNTLDLSRGRDIFVYNIVEYIYRTLLYDISFSIIFNSSYIVSYRSLTCLIQ